MLKYPRPGAVKTRLIPALGERRAAELHRALVRHTIAEVTRFAARHDVAVEARIAGAPDEAASRAWLGGEMAISAQGDGDLGQRMDRAAQAALADGAANVVVIGGDCPQLTAEHLAAAFATLGHADVVLGPATDGGYYLIGLRAPQPTLFQGISWGGAEVLVQTLAAARSISVKVEQLATLRDVDVPDDLAVWAETASARAAGRGGVSVIIPALNEEASLPATLSAALKAGPHEVIVVDGGSGDRTVEIARRHETIVLAAPPGRARQMNRGAAAATGEFLLFLHADTILPGGYAAHIGATLARDGVAGGAFGFALEGEFAGRRWIERMTNWRARRRQLPYGDQGIFVRREIFGQVGGFPELPIMEDYALIRRLRRLGRVVIAPAVAVTSGRRWQRRGPWRTTLLNQVVVLGYRLGVPPARLAAWYRGE